MILPFLAGFYAGLGLAVGIAYYVSDDPWKDGQTRLERGLQAFVAAVLWLPFLIFALGPLIAKDVWGYLSTDTAKGGPD